MSEDTEPVDLESALRDGLADFVTPAASSRDTVPLPSETDDGLFATADGSDAVEAPPNSGRIGGYLLEDELARGGMGVIFRARDSELNRTVALKVLLAGALASPQQRERFRLEAQAAARLRHPNIVAIHNVGEDEGRAYLVMDLVDGESLGARLDRDGPLPPREAAALMQKVALALQFAHEHSVLHRDLKPDNVLISAKGEPLLTDFGLAKLLDSQVTGPTLTGQFLGTPGFMSPEQVRATTVDPRTDVYGLGSTLYALLTGVPPFDAEVILELAAKVIHDEPRPPSQLRPEVPQILDTICLVCLEKNPLYRYASAKALADDLGRFLAGEPISGKAPGLLRREWEALSQNRKTSPITNAALILFAVVMVWLVWRVNGWNSYHALTLQLDSRAAYTRACAADKLSEHPGTGTAILLLASARTDESPTVRLAALRSLETMLGESALKPQHVLPVLLATLERRDGTSRERDVAWRLSHQVATQLGAPGGQDPQAWKDWLQSR